AGFTVRDASVYPHGHSLFLLLCVIVAQGYYAFNRQKPTRRCSSPKVECTKLSGNPLRPTPKPGRKAERAPNPRTRSANSSAGSTPGLVDCSVFEMEKVPGPGPILVSVGILGHQGLGAELARGDLALFAQAIVGRLKRGVVGGVTVDHDAHAEARQAVAVAQLGVAIGDQHQRAVDVWGDLLQVIEILDADQANSIDPGGLVGLGAGD